MKNEMRQTLLRSLSIFAAIVFTSVSTVFAASDEPMRDEVTRIVSQIQRADYEGNQVAMQKGYDELAPFVANQELVSRVRYWRAFAMWRRAINGLNDSVDPNELEQHLTRALDEFKQALAKEPGFVDAKIGMVSCLSLVGYINRTDPARVQELLGQVVSLAKEVKADAPDNPRLLWVLGQNIFVAPRERGGGQDKAIETYKKGLELSRKSKPSADPLEPSWGEPELLMNLAWSNLNGSTPDLNAAENYAQSALGIVPYWHYVRDILLPQILAAKEKLNVH